MKFRFNQILKYFSFGTHFLIIYTFILATGLIITLFALERMHRIHEAGQAYLVSIELNNSLKRFREGITEILIPAASETWLMEDKSKEGGFRNLIHQTDKQFLSLAKNPFVTRNAELRTGFTSLQNTYQQLRETILTLLPYFDAIGCLHTGLTGKTDSLMALHVSRGNRSTGGGGYASELLRLYSLYIISGNESLLKDIEKSLVNYLNAKELSDPAQSNPLRQLQPVVANLLKIRQNLSRNRRLESLTGLASEASYASSAFKEQVRLHTKHLQKSSYLTLPLLTGLSGLLLLLLVYGISRKIQVSLNKIHTYTADLVQGRIPVKIYERNSADFSSVFEILNRYAEDLQKKARFARELSRANYMGEYSPLSEEDLLGISLIGLGKSLKDAEKARREFEKEDRKRRWTSEALARFAEVLRLSSSDISFLSDQVIRHLTRELKASQGALYLLQEDTPEGTLLTMVTAFAYDRKKYLTSSFRLGEGLVGTCAVEKNTLFLTEIPEQYIKISSGLGESKPRCLVLVPIKIEDKVLGVIELASLNIIETHAIEFLEKIAESIASTISMVQINTRNRLLLEKLQQQARELAEQDKKMRQNIEMLQVAQVEASRREKEIAGILSAINNSSLVIEFDTETRILSVNERLCQLLGTRPQLVIGKRYATLLNPDVSSESYQQLWNDLREGKPGHTVESLRLPGNREIWLSLSFTPIQGTDNEIRKLLCIAADITESKEQEINLQERTRELLRKNLELETLYHAVDNSLLRCILNADGGITGTNENYLRITGYSREDVLGKNYRFFLKQDELEQFQKIWNEVLKDKSYTGVLKRTKPTGEEVWLMSGFTPLKDKNGRIYKIYCLAQDITERRLKYKLLEEANKEIERLRTLMEKQMK